MFVISDQETTFSFDCIKEKLHFLKLFVSKIIIDFVPLQMDLRNPIFTTIKYDFVVLVEILFLHF